LDTAQYRRRALALALLAVAAIPLGCGKSGPEMARVSGKVTYKGQPVPKGTITFVSSDPGRRNATGVLAPDGTYRLQTEEPGDGAMLGDYKVTVSAHDEPVLDYIPAKPVPKKLLVPETYESPQASTLKATVVRGSNTCDFDLTDADVPAASRGNRPARPRGCSRPSRPRPPAGP
jgi:hypothetical protein